MDSFLEDTGYTFDLFRYSRGRDPPNEIMADFPIFVRKDVAQANHAAPRNLGVASAAGLRESSGRFAYYLEQALYCQLKHPIRVVIGKLDVGCVGPNLLGCVENVP